MKKILFAFIATLIFLPSLVSASYAVPLSATTTTGTILAFPTMVNSIFPNIMSPIFIATSTTATSTFANGINLTGGCFAVNGTCIGQSSASSTLLSDNNTFSGTDTFSNASSNFAGTLSGDSLSTILASAFSTTSAAYWLTLNQGAAFSTTSANYLLGTKGYLTSTGIESTSTNPFMATYFIATSTTQASSFPYASSTAISASGTIFANNFYDTSLSGNTCVSESSSLIVGSTYCVTSVSATWPLASSGGTNPIISSATSSASSAGVLSAADWTTFNSKQAALTFSWPLVNTANTVSFNGLATTSPWANGNLAEVSGGNLTSVPTTTVSCSGSASCTSFTILGSSPITISDSGGGGGAWPFTPAANDGQSVQSTTTAEWFNVTPFALMASGTIDVAGNSGGYAIDENTILQASSTNGSLMIGQNAGPNLFSSSIHNVAIGLNALQNATTTNSNVAIGWDAMQGSGATTAFSNGNIAIGPQSLMSIMTGNGVAGSANTAVGSSTLRLLTTGSSNTAMGSLAGHSITTGSSNTTVGSNAGGGITTAGNISAFGTNALTADTAGQDSAFGSSALQFNTSGVGNNAYGYLSLNHVSTHNNNSAFGNNSMASTTGDGNVGFGTNTGINLLNITSASSTFLGAFAGQGAIAGYGETGTTLVGAGSGWNLASSSNWNTCVGTQSCFNLTSGADNIIIGSASTTANDNLTTGDDNIKIGDNISFPNAAGNDQLDIGNEIYGTNINGVGSTLSTGNIGIGTSTPGNLLSVWGDNSAIAVGTNSSANNAITFEGGRAVVGHSTTVFGSDGGFAYLEGGTNRGLGLSVNNTATPVLYINISNNVGIGTTTPGSLLSLNNIANFTTATSTFYGNGLSITAGCYAIVTTCLGLNNLPGTVAVTSGGTGSTSFANNTGIMAYSSGSSQILNYSGYSLTSSLFTATNASTTVLTAGSSNPFFVAANGEITGYDFLTSAQGQISPMRYLSFKLATSTTWTATSSAASAYGDSAVVVMPFAGTLRTLSCWTNTGTLEISATVNGGTSNYLPASTTAGTYTLSSTFTQGATTTIIAGNPASSPVFASCTMGATQT